MLAVDLAFEEFGHSDNAPHYPARFFLPLPETGGK